MNEIMTDILAGLEEIVEGKVESATTSNKIFAEDLLRGRYGYHQRGYLTENQIRAAAKMINYLVKAENPPPSDTAPSLEKVYAFFQGAKRFLKYPKIVVGMGDTSLKIYLSGKRSRYPDTINLVADGDVWLGRVFASGEWQHRHDNPELHAQAAEMLKRLAEDPAGTAAEHGHKTGNCCFCSHPLTDDRSVAVGFGPVCADKWGLKSFWKRAADNDKMAPAAHVAHRLKTGETPMQTGARR